MCIVISSVVCMLSVQGRKKILHIGYTSLSCVSAKMEEGTLSNFTLIFKKNLFYKSYQDFSTYKGFFLLPIPFCSKQTIKDIKNETVSVREGRRPALVNQ